MAEALVTTDIVINRPNWYSRTTYHLSYDRKYTSGRSTGKFAGIWDNAFSYLKDGI